LEDLLNPLCLSRIRNELQSGGTQLSPLQLLSGVQNLFLIFLFGQAIMSFAGGFKDLAKVS